MSGGRGATYAWLSEFNRVACCPMNESRELRYGRLVLRAASRGRDAKSPPFYEGQREFTRRFLEHQQEFDGAKRVKYWSVPAPAPAE